MIFSTPSRKKRIDQCVYFFFLFFYFLLLENREMCFIAMYKTTKMSQHTCNVCSWSFRACGQTMPESIVNLPRKISVKKKLRYEEPQTVLH